MKLFLTLCVIAVTTLGFTQPTNWENRGAGGGGSLFTPSISPHDADEMYMHCDMTEVFHSDDAGLSWEVTHFEELLSTGGIHTVEFTSDPNILYAVDFEFRLDEYIPMKSTDGGASWSPLASDPTGGGCWYISADPASSDRLIVASYTTMYFSNDGGSSFQQVFANGGAFYISGVFWDGTDIYVGTQEGLVISTDNGVNFSLDATPGIPANHGFMSFCGSKQSGTVRLMGTIASQADIYPGVKALEVYSYVDLLSLDYGAASWSSATTGISSNHRLFHMGSSLANTNVYYVSGTDVSTSYPVVYRTDDGGGSWSEIFNTTNNQNITTGWSGYQGDEDWWYGEIVFGLAVAPNDPDVAVITDFGFAHVTTDGGTSWRQAYVDQTDENPAGSATPQDLAYESIGLENTSVWHVTWG